MSDTFFIADTHFGHKNVIDYCKRPFASVEEMDREMIRRWQDRVDADDKVYILGDFCFKSANYACAILDQLPGRKFLVRGNHDSGLLKKQAFKDRFEWVRDIGEIKIPEGDKSRRIVMCHYRMAVWNESHRGSWLLHGHSHGSMLDTGGYVLDVGVDATRTYAPVSLMYVAGFMSSRSPTVGLDHHNERTN